MTPAHPSRSLHDQAGLIGKVAVFWIIAALLAALLILDALSIVLTTFRLSSTAQGAASTAATTYKNSHNAADACEAAGVELLRDNTPIPESEGWCKINTTTGTAADLAARGRVEPGPGSSLRHRGLHEDLRQGDRRAVVVVACRRDRRSRRAPRPALPRG